MIESLKNLKEVITPYNFDNIFYLLCKLHFQYVFSGNEVYTLLKRIAVKSGRSDVIHLYEKVERLFLTNGPEVTQVAA